MPLPRNAGRTNIRFYLDAPRVDRSERSATNRFVSDVCDDEVALCKRELKPIDPMDRRIWITGREFVIQFTQQAHSDNLVDRRCADSVAGLAISDLSVSV